MWRGKSKKESSMSVRRNIMYAVQDRLKTNINIFASSITD